MDVDAYVAAHRNTWLRLETMTKRPGKLRGAELDELVDLYQRTATHLSVVRTTSPDPQLVSSLTSLVARSRAAITGRRTIGWRAIPQFAIRDFPAAAWSNRRWWLGVAVSTMLMALAATTWLANHPDVRGKLISAAQTQALESEFVNYYSDHPHGSFAAEVWTHNALIAAEALVFGLLLGLPTFYFMASTAFQLAVPAGYLFANGKGGEFLTYILPHGMLELTSVFLAMGTGLRLGWTVVDPGRRSRVRALSEEFRRAFVLVIGIGLTLLCSGIIEGFVTPAKVLQPWEKLTIGGIAEAAFLTYIIVLGRRAVAAGFTGDIAEDLRGDYLPEAA